MKAKFFLLIILGCYALNATSKVFINEYMQSNANTLFDEEYNLPESWVELYNDGEETISLKGWKIGLKKQSKGYTLPDSIKILAKGFLVLFCDESDLGGLHSNFELPLDNGNSIFLLNNYGEEEDCMPVKTVLSAYDYSVGRFPDGTDNIQFFTKATPNTPNQNIAKNRQRTPSVKFSKVGGFTDSTEIEISLYVQNDIKNSNVRIKYTTDGSEPTEDSPTYTEPLHLENKSDSLKVYVIKAKTFADSVISSKSITHSYIFAGRHVDLPIMSITTDPKYLWDNDYGIYVKGNGRGISIFKDSHPYTDDYNFWSNNVRFCNVEYFSKNGGWADVNMPAELRIGGNAARWKDQKTLMVTCKKRFSEHGSFNFAFFESKKDMKDIESLILRNAGNDCEYAFLRDAFCQTIGSQFENIDYQAYQPSIVFINGEYYGIHNIRERSNEKWVKSNFNTEDSDVIENWVDVKNGSLEHLFYTLEFLKKDASYGQVSSLIDVKELSNYLSINSFMANRDFITNNVLVWRKENEKWRFLLKDIDMSIGDERFENMESNFKKNMLSYYFSKEPYMMKDIIRFNEYKDYFISNHIINIGTYFHEKKTLDILDSLANNIEYEIAFHNDKYQLIDDWYSEIEYMRLWLKNRPYYESQNLSKFFDLGTPVPTVIAGTEHDVLLVDSLKITENKFDGYFFKNKEMTLSSAIPDISWKIIRKKDGQDYIEICKSQQITIKPEQNDSIIILAGLENLPGKLNNFDSQKHYVPIAVNKGVLFEDISNISSISVYNQSGQIIDKLDKLKTNKIKIKLPKKNCIYLILLTDKYGKTHICKFVYI
jgi:hypothetical protein